MMSRLCKIPILGSLSSYQKWSNVNGDLFRTERLPQNTSSPLKIHMFACLFNRAMFIWQNFTSWPILIVRSYPKL